MSTDQTAARYWCHACACRVNPNMGGQMIACPNCGDGVVEETEVRPRMRDPDEVVNEVSFWLPIFFGFDGAAALRHRVNHEPDPDDLAADTAETPDQRRRRRRRRRRPRVISMTEMLQALRVSLSEENEEDYNGPVLDVAGENPDGPLMILDTGGPISGGLSLEDYHASELSLDEFIIQHLAENDTTRQGTPPAEKAAVAGLPTIRIRKGMPCPVCLDEMLAGVEGREMPCKHVFHEGCLLPWLEINSSCPVCRFQLPTEDSKGSSSEGGGYGGRPLGAPANSDFELGGSGGSEGP